MDEYNSKLSEVARLIQSHTTLASEITTPGTKKLQEWAEGKDGGKEYMVLEFKRQINRPGWIDLAGATLSIDVLGDGDSLFGDQNGNLWANFRIYPKIFWPLYSGGSGPEAAAARIQLMSEVCALATLISERFSEPFSKMVKTRAEREEAAAAQDMKVLEETLNQAIRENPRLRVGAEHIVQNDELKSVGAKIAEGIVIKNRTYTVVHKATEAYAKIIRTA